MPRSSFHVTIDDDLLREMRLRCVSDEVSYSDFVEDAIRVKLGSGGGAVKKFKAEPPKEKPAAPVEVPESEERRIAMTSECCDAEIVRNTKNFPSCKKCGKVV